MSKFEKWKLKSPKNSHFFLEKVTKIENYIISKVHFIINLVPLRTVGQNSIVTAF